VANAHLYSSLLPSSCKIFASAGAGFDWVDTKRLAQRGIIYCNSAPACTESVADAAIWLILSTFRRFTWSSLAARSTDPARFKSAHEDIPGRTNNPNGFKLGIIGLGRIGFRIAQKAKLAFEMNVLYHDIRRLPSNIERSIAAHYYENLDDMLAEADCIVLATPFIGDSLMNAERFAKIKHGGRFVNIARGKLVDEEALIAALASGRISCAGLDVHYDEPNVNPKLAAMDNVELLCHTAGASLNSHVGFERLGMENIISFFETGEALTPVNIHWITKAKF
jgi:lactate dehydrogenase-like 2-hydroxyacid dehydrogenase